jgi:tRNA pseudouridine55 synthase
LRRRGHVLWTVWSLQLTEPSIDGVLVIDKPLGLTSHDVVARARRVLGTRRIGHTGTLDPLATGVLPLVIGRATRLASLMTGTTKEYLAAVRFGAATPTYDAEARLLRDPQSGDPEGLAPAPPAPQGLDAAVIEANLERFRGAISQTPPAFSAKKIEGVAAYKRARRNEAVAPKPVTVAAHATALESYADGLARIRLTTSAGFYVRSFAHDLGQAVGCGAHLEALRRVRSGEFGLDRAVTLDAFHAEGFEPAAALIPLERLLLDLPSVVLTDRGRQLTAHGNLLSPEDFSGPPSVAEVEWIRLLDAAGALIGIAKPAGQGLLHPTIVLV